MPVFILGSSRRCLMAPSPHRIQHAERVFGRRSQGHDRTPPGCKQSRSASHPSSSARRRLSQRQHSLTAAFGGSRQSVTISADGYSHVGGLTIAKSWPPLREVNTSRSRCRRQARIRAGERARRSNRPTRSAREPPNNSTRDSGLRWNRSTLRFSTQTRSRSIAVASCLATRPSDCPTNKSSRSAGTPRRWRMS